MVIWGELKEEDETISTEDVLDRYKVHGYLPTRG